MSTDKAKLPDSEKEARAEVGLFKSKITSGDRPFVETLILQKEPLEADHGEKDWYGNDSVFAVGKEARSAVEAELRKRKDRGMGITTQGMSGGSAVFSSFKADLIEGLGREAGYMRAFYPRDELNIEAGLPGHLEKPRTVVEAFAGTLIRDVIGVLSKEKQFENAKYKVYFTQPALGERSLSDKYRETFKEYVIPGLSDGMSEANLDVEFPEKGDFSFMYEPYGAYHFVSRFFTLHEEQGMRSTFLVVDVGGATTDVAIVQAKAGKTPVAVPVSDSVRVAGDRLDEILLLKLDFQNPGEAPTQDELESRISERGTALYRDLMQRIRQAKEEVSTKNKAVSLTIAGKKATMDSQSIESAFAEWWPEIKEAISGVIKRAKRRGKDKKDTLIEGFDEIDRVFLAGGGSQVHADDVNMLGLYLNLFEEVEEDRIVEPNELGLNASTLAAAGLALNVRGENVENRGGEKNAKIDETVYIHGRFRARYEGFSSGGKEFLRFGRKGPIDGSPLPSSPESDAVVLASKKEILSDEENSTPQTTSFDWGEFEDEPISEYRGLSGIELEVQTNIMGEEWKNAGAVELKDFQEGYPYLTHRMTVYKSERLEDGSLKYHHRSEYGCFGKHITKRDENNVYAASRGGRNEKVKLRTSRRYDTRRDDVIICVDLGMTNTAVAVYAPGRNLPKEHFDLVDHVSDASADGVQVQSRENRNGEAQRHDNNDDPVQERELEETPSSKSRPENHGELIDELESLEQKLKALEERLMRLEDKEQSDDYQERSVFSFPEAEPIDRRAESVPDLYEELSDRYGYLGKPAIREVQYHLETKSPRIILLTGPPGTGKSSFTGKVARLVNPHPNSFELVPVSPTWFDHVSLLGGAGDFGTFHRTAFAKLLIRAWRAHGRDGEKASRYFVCLDEINLAHPEQYLAPLLAAMEAENPEERKIVIRGFHPREEDPDYLYFPPNMTLFGTLNLDATTKTLSPKLLDRSLLIRMKPGSDHLKAEFEKSYTEVRKDGNEGVSEAYEIMKSLLFVEENGRPSLYDVSGSAQSPFGFRAVQRAGRLLGKLERTERTEELVDHILCSVFLSKLPGGSSIPGHEFAENLKSFEKRLDARKHAGMHFAESLDTVQRMLGGLPGQFA